MAAFDKIKGKVNNFFFSNDDDYEEERYNEDEQQADNAPIFEHDQGSSPIQESYYSPTSGLNPPEYDFGKTSQKTTYGSAPEYRNTQKDTERKSGNIYNMNAVRPVTKFKLNLVIFKDVYGVIKVADLLMKKDTIVLVDISNLPDESRMRAMDFLDGVMYVTKSLFSKLSENIAVYVPEGVELHGDFPSQIDINSIQQF